MAKMTVESGQAPDDAEKRRRDRQRYWARKLGRLRLGVEPLDMQLARYRRVTWALTLVPGVIALIFIAIFAAFKRPDIGLILVGIVLAPVVVIAWLDYARLARNVRRYQAEREGPPTRDRT
jgi:hypothetical protein